MNMNSFYNKTINELKISLLNDTEEKTHLFDYFNKKKKKILNKEKQLLDKILKLDKERQNNLTKIETLKKNIKEKENNKTTNLTRELDIFKKEKNRIEEKLKLNEAIYIKNLDYNNNIIYYINFNNENIEQCITQLKTKRQSNKITKYKTRNIIEKDIILNKKNSILKKKHIILYKSKINTIINKIKELNKQYNINIKRHKEANKKYYEIQDAINKLKKQIIDNEQIINELINVSNTEEEILEKIKIKENIEEEIVTLLNKPECRLDIFYKTIGDENDTLLKELDILNCNKIQLEELIKTNKFNIIKQEKNNYIHEEKKYKNEILKLNSRLHKNKINITYLLEDNKVLDDNYNNTIINENYHSKKAEKRLDITSSRINTIFEDYLKEENNNIKRKNIKIIELKENIINIKSDIKKLNMTIINNENEYQEKKNELDNSINYTNKQIIKFKKLSK